MRRLSLLAAALLAAASFAQSAFGDCSKPYVRFQLESLVPNEKGATWTPEEFREFLVTATARLDPKAREEFLAKLHSLSPEERTAIVFDLYKTSHTFSDFEQAITQQEFVDFLQVAVLDRNPAAYEAWPETLKAAGNWNALSPEQQPVLAKAAIDLVAEANYRLVHRNANRTDVFYEVRGALNVLIEYPQGAAAQQALEGLGNSLFKGFHTFQHIYQLACLLNRVPLRQSITTDAGIIEALSDDFPIGRDLARAITLNRLPMDMIPAQERAQLVDAFNAWVERQARDRGDHLFKEVKPFIGHPWKP